MDTKEYVSLLFPNGRAYNNVGDSELFNEVIALQIDRIVAQVQNFQDQIWYFNSNFDPEPWEKRYNIDVPLAATLEERQQTVKSYMIYPQSDNRLSIDYIQGQLNLAGFPNVIVSTNEAEASEGKLHGNNITSTENYTIGPDAYNSFIISGTLKVNYYEKMLLLLMSIKPLDSAVYDTVDVALAMAYDDDFALALDDDFVLAIDEL
jgi:hypothetical protein